MRATHRHCPTALSTALILTAGGLATAAAASAAPAITGGGHQVSKVVVVVEENHSTAQMKAGMPYLTGLARRYGQATHYKALSHPSEPNYLAIAAGSTFGIHNDDDPSANAQSGPSVFGQAADAGLSAGTYSESMHGSCVLTGNTDNGYAVKHNPQAFFTDERANCQASNVSDAGFTADATADQLPNITFLVPDKRDDAHDGTLADADGYLHKTLPAVLASRDFASGRLAIVVTADEDDGGSGNGVYTVVLHKDLAGKSVSTPLTHYSLSAMLSQTVGASPLREAQKAPDMAAAFGLHVGPATSTGGSDPTPTSDPTSTPDPTSTSTSTSTPEPTDTVEPLPATSSSGTSSSGGGSLAWSPPRLDHPIHLTVPDDGQVTHLAADQDYLLTIKGTVHGTLHIDGGHDVVLVGGRVDAGASRDAYLHNQTGTMHLEGVDFVSKSAHEGLNLAEPQSATVQLENVRVAQVNGSYRTHHADLIQTWSGPGHLQVDRFEGWTTYQGFFFLPGQHTASAGPWFFDLRHTVTRDVAGRSVYHDWFPSSAAFHLTTDSLVAVKPAGDVKHTVWSHPGAVEVLDSAPSPLTGNPGDRYTSPGYGS